MAWTDEMVADLRQMWADGLTTGEIAKRLSVSKNSIVGKVHRLGLSGRPSPIKKKSAPSEGIACAPKALKTPKKEIIAEEIKVEDAVAANKESKKVKEPKEPKQTKENTAHVSGTINAELSKGVKKDKEPAKLIDGVIRLADLDAHTCRWPIGDPKDEKFHFCGKKVRIGHTYCDEHSETAYVKQTKKS